MSIKVKYKEIQTGKTKSTDFDHLQTMIVVDRRCPQRSIQVDDPNFKEENGKLIKIANRGSNTEDIGKAEKRQPVKKGGDEA